VTLSDRFEAAVARSRGLPKQPNDVLLKLYALYKQSTAGDVSGSRPGMLDMVGRAKHDAWAELRGLASDDAKRQYVDLVASLSAD
jgi:acyl-CoA-binding protein